MPGRPRAPRTSAIVSEGYATVIIVSVTLARGIYKLKKKKKKKKEIAKRHYRKSKYPVAAIGNCTVTVKRGESRSVAREMVAHAN